MKTRQKLQYSSNIFINSEWRLLILNSNTQWNCPFNRMNAVNFIYLQFRGPKSVALCLIFSTRSIILPTRSRSAVSRTSFLCITSMIASRSAGSNDVDDVLPVLHPVRSLICIRWRGELKSACKRRSNNILVNYFCWILRGHIKLPRTLHEKNGKKASNEQENKSHQVLCTQLALFMNVLSK